jgi:hypothetical protein
MRARPSAAEPGPSPAGIGRKGLQPVVIGTPKGLLPGDVPAPVYVKKIKNPAYLGIMLDRCSCVA